MPVIEQSLQDLIDWVERGDRAGRHQLHLRDGKVTLPPRAAERGGIQPVVEVTANGAVDRGQGRPERSTLAVPRGAAAGPGSIVEVKWDFDGGGIYPFTDPSVDGRASKVSLTKTHSYDKPGTYFATALVSHRDGDQRVAAAAEPGPGAHHQWVEGRAPTPFLILRCSPLHGAPVRWGGLN